MIAVEADLMDGALTISAQDTAAALAAAESALSAAPGSARHALTSLGFALTEPDAAFSVIGFRGVLDGPADAALDALAPFADGQTLVFEDDNGVRWRYLMAGGQRIEQTPALLWRDVNDRTPRAGDVLAPLTLARDPETFAAWWKSLPDTTFITEALDGLSQPDAPHCEQSLSSLMSEVFQRDTEVAWLKVTGLRRGCTPQWVAIDIDPAHDGDGIIDGVDVALNLLAPRTNSDGPQPWLSTSAYVGKPWRIFQPTSADPCAALAEIIDTAVAVINREIADQDRATFAARDCLSP